jgi:hypothetical protein
MSTTDPVATLLTGLGRPVVPRAEFAEALITRLLAELHLPATSSKRRTGGLRFDRLLTGIPQRLRPVLVAILLLLLLAGIATATYLGVRTWVSTSPRGVQYTSEYRLTTAVAPAPTRNEIGCSSFALGPDGRDLYASHIRFTSRRRRGLARSRLQELLRVDGVDRGTRPHTTRRLRRAMSPALSG